MKTIFLWSRILIFVHSNYRKVVSKGGAVEETLRYKFSPYELYRQRTETHAFVSVWKLTAKHWLS